MIPQPDKPSADEQQPRWEWAEWDSWFEHDLHPPLTTEQMVVDYLNGLETRLESALAKLKEIADGHAWENPPAAARRFLDELEG